MTGIPAVKVTGVSPVRAASGANWVYGYLISGVSASVGSRSACQEKGSRAGVGMARWSSVWTRRGLLAVVLIGAAIIPGYANESATEHCAGSRCESTGTIRWAQPLTGSLER